MEKIGSTSHVDDAEVANARGNGLYRAGNVEGAISAYTEALKATATTSMTPGRNCESPDDFKCRSKYYANR